MVIPCGGLAAVGTVQLVWRLLRAFCLSCLRQGQRLHHEGEGPGEVARRGWDFGDWPFPDTSSVLTAT